MTSVTYFGTAIAVTVTCVGELGLPGVAEKAMSRELTEKTGATSGISTATSLLPMGS